MKREKKDECSTTKKGIVELYTANTYPTLKTYDWTKYLAINKSAGFSYLNSTKQRNHHVRPYCYW